MRKDSNPLLGVELSRKTKVIPANAIAVADNVTGSLFLCVEASNRFQVSFNEKKWFDFDLGLKFVLDSGKQFTKLYFRTAPDLGDNPVSITYFYGRGIGVEDARLNIVRDPNHIQIITSFPAPSYAARPLPDELANAAELVLPGILSRGTWPCYPASDWLYALPDGIDRAQRKSIRIESDQTLNVLWWNGVEGDEESGIILGVAPTATGAPFYEETSQELVLQNDSGSTANIKLLALYDYPVWYSATSELP